VRWHDPERGLIAPAAFIPYAEDTGLIEDIGHRVLERVCDQLIGMNDGVWVSINVSPRELAAPGFATALTATLQRYQIDPTALVVELTETAIVTDPERVATALSLLRAGGVRLALDDFGSGYSSLARLTELPFDLLKIDSRFLRSVPSDPDAARMLRAVIEFTRALGLTTVAEGVETDGQRDTLVDLGCSLAQGWLLGRPAPPEHWVSRMAV
jgi:EAL domain-containing protein (putative c-di-GMP-specific phosphodiesterase class I)